MGKKKEPCDCPKCLPGWLAAFGDLMSLLLCFFVLLLSMSSMDARKVEDAIGSLAGALSVLEGGSKTEISREKQQQDNPIKKDDNSAKALKSLQNNIEELNEMLKSSGAPQATIKESQDGFIIQLPASLLFRPDSADITNEDALLFLRRIALIIKRLPQNIMLDVIGYTDNIGPSKKSQFIDNWQLSSARATSVVREFIKDKVKPSRLISSGRAQYDPIATNATEEGRMKNRRVELHFYSVGKEKKLKNKKTILDEVRKTK